ncbi:hypothetical protein RDV64_00970 [Acuticoccus sp. MNP-M23]|uniref:hypothetical protein n=1 Tax=Acuticoccus sp. MNP-M23 TaxID=3072793 RepID=UPI002815F262|nr:hypothetical protein [Acuticoccus sp. MNP-M23]WMS43005.1 hypothetical protein RDV64_00970 [Acuticoccus sp. MNP-M23]
MDGYVLADTATKLSAARGKVVICGSHGGVYAGLLAASAGVRGILLNDAGVGLNNAGIAGLGVCQTHGMAAAAVGHDSCRIGDAADCGRRGVVSAANAIAAGLGIVAGIGAVEAAGLLAGAPEPTGTPVVDEEHRIEHDLGGWRLTIIDSASLVDFARDRGALVVTASHGGLVGGNPATAGRADAALFAYNDAGIGCDRAGVSRLPVLQERGIAAVTVDCRSAEIGVGQSTYDRGVISAANQAARTLGAKDGMPLKALIAAIAARPPVRG